MKKNIRKREIRTKNKKRRLKSFFLRAAKFVCVCLLFSFTGACVYQGYMYVMTSPYFIVKAIKIEGNRVVEKKEILKISKLHEGMNIFNFTIKDVSFRVTGHPWIKEAIVERKFPDELFIKIYERNPYAVIHSQKYYVVDEEGVVLGMTDEINSTLLPVINSDRNILAVPGDKISDEAFFEGKKFLAASVDSLFFREEGISVIELTNEGNLLVLTKTNDIPLKFNRFRMESGLSRLESIVEILPEEPIRKIDLSYKNQVVVQIENENPVQGYTKVASLNSKVIDQLAINMD